MANLNKQGFIDIDPNTLTEQELFLLYQTMKGYKWRYDNDPEYSEEYKRDVIIPRFKKELNTIIGKKYTEYISLTYKTLPISAETMIYHLDRLEDLPEVL